MSETQLKRKQAKEQKKAEKSQNLHAELREALAAVIDMQIAGHESVDDADKAQHSHDWQLYHLPKHAALVVAGHKKLANRIANYKTQMGYDGKETSCELLAQHLGWCCVDSPSDRVDAEQVRTH